MLAVLQKVFKDKVASPVRQEKLHQVVPSYGTQLNSRPEKVAEEWGYDSVTSDRLGSSPRKTLNYETPAERFSQSVASIG